MRWLLPSFPDPAKHGRDEPPRHERWAETGTELMPAAPWGGRAAGRGAPAPPASAGWAESAESLPAETWPDTERRASARSPRCSPSIEIDARRIADLAKRRGFLKEITSPFWLTKPGGDKPRWKTESVCPRTPFFL